MTRINLVPPSDLSDAHLVAEYREIMRLPGNLNKSLNRKAKPFSMSEIPDSYTLGSGHVKFFYDKMEFLDTRFKSLVVEMGRRGFKASFADTDVFKSCPSRFYNDYTPTTEEISINVSRIRERSS